jgi:hypothetical protein
LPLHFLRNINDLLVDLLDLLCLLHTRSSLDRPTREVPLPSAL